MAGPWFYRSAAAGTGDGLSWTNARTTLATQTSVVAGDTLWVADDHAETQASALTITLPGTVSNPNFVYCVDHTQASPGTGDLRTTGTVTTTGNSAISIQGVHYCYGITFNQGTGANALGLVLGNGSGNLVTVQKYEACAFNLVATGASFLAVWNQAGSQGYLEFINCTITFGAVGQSIAYGGGRFIWRNTVSAFGGATFPTNLFFVSVSVINILLEGVDLSALGSGKTIVQAAQNCSGTITFKDCKLNAAVTVASSPTTTNGSLITFVIRSDSAGTNYIEQLYKYEGSQVNELTIVRTGGASNGTTSESRKIVTTANSKWVLPFETIPIAIWNDTAGSPTTVTIFGTTTGGGVPKDDEIWFDAEYLGSASSPQGSFQTTTKANNLAASAAVNNSADGSTWGGSGAGNGFKIVSPSFTPQQKGYIYVYVKAAKVSSTYYIDPLIKLN